MLTTYTYDDNGNLTTITEHKGATDLTYKMAYDKENRLSTHKVDLGVVRGLPTTYTYDGDGLKRCEIPPAPAGARTTLIWDGTSYLGEQS